MREASGNGYAAASSIVSARRTANGSVLGTGSCRNDGEQRVIAEMRALRSGTKPNSYARIAAGLNARGEFIAAHLRFPTAAHDDQVDAAELAVRQLRELDMARTCRSRILDALRDNPGGTGPS